MPDLRPAGLPDGEWRVMRAVAVGLAALVLFLVAVSWARAGVQRGVWARQGCELSHWEVFMGATPIWQAAPAGARQ